MAASKDNPTVSGMPDDLATSATEGMLGPNPFVGLRAQDIFASIQQLGEQAARHPRVLFEQETKLLAS